MIGTVILLFIVFVTALVILTGKTQGFEKQVGEKQASLFSVYSAGEERLYGLQDSSAVIARQLISDLAEQGGFWQQQSCGSYADAPLWYGTRNTQEPKEMFCYPSRASTKDLFETAFTTSLKKIYPTLPSYEFLYRGKLAVYGTTDAREIITSSDDAGIKYFISPELSFEIPADLGDYVKLRLLAKILVAECSKVNDVKSCVDDLTQQFTEKSEFTFGECNNEQEHAWQSVITGVEECLTATNDACLCTIPVPATPEKETSIRVLNEQDLTFKGIINGREQSYTLPEARINPNDFTLTTKKEQQKLLFLKNGMTLERVEQPDHHAQCQLKPRMFAFCATRKESSLFVYDAAKAAYTPKPLQYRFALSFANPPPPPVPKVTVVDKEKAEQSIVVQWDEPSTKDGKAIADINYYNIYCTSGSIDQTVAGIKPVIAVFDHGNGEEKTGLTTCRDVQGKIIPLEDGKHYTVTVTAVDLAGQEDQKIIAKDEADGSTTKGSNDDLAPAAVKINVNGIAQSGATAQGTSSGSLAVSWNAPALNEDGSVCKDYLGAQVYASSTSRDPSTDPTCSDPSFCTFATGTSATIPLAAGQPYTMTVFAVDNTKNKAMQPWTLPEQWKGLSTKIAHYNEDGTRMSR